MSYPIPILFTNGSRFGANAMFGLLEIVAGRVLITPTVQITNDKVRHLFAAKPKSVPDDIDILVGG